jgi:hypothetical protein
MIKIRNKAMARKAMETGTQTKMYRSFDMVLLHFSFIP